MSTSFPFYVVNAFASHPFQGNPAAVFPSADGLSDEQMQAVAKQMNLVETVFITSPTVNDADFRLRFFTPKKELPVAGHPTIAAWSALAIGKHIELSARKEFRQQTLKGIQTIMFEGTNDSFKVLMQHPEPRFLGIIENRTQVAEVFSISEDDLLPTLPVETVDTGLGHIVFGVRSLEALMRVRRNIAPLKELCSNFTAAEAQIFCEETYDHTLSLHTRNICPREGIEDPACGVGTSALLAYLMKNKVYPEKSVEISAEQGLIEGMPSIVYARGQWKDGKMELSIGGSGVLMVKGEFLL